MCSVYGLENTVIAMGVPIKCNYKAVYTQCSMAKLAKDIITDVDGAVPLLIGVVVVDGPRANHECCANLARRIVAKCCTPENQKLHSSFLNRQIYRDELL